MWFEILPGFGIVYGAMMFPGYATWWLHYFVIGNHYRRGLTDRWHRSLYQRDLRLTGNPYVQNGLESIPDE